MDRDRVALTARPRRRTGTGRRVAYVALAAVPVAVIGIFFVLPVGAMLERGLWEPTADGGTRFAPGAVVDVLARPRTGRVLWFTVWTSTVATAIAVLLGLPAAYVLHRLRFPGRGFIRAALLVPFVLPTVVVGLAVRELIASSGPLGSLGLDGTPIAILIGLVFFNVAVVIRTVGATWESLDRRPGQAAAALGATPWQVFRTVTFPALRPAIVSAASVVFLFCATSFGVVLVLGGVRYASVETEIYLLTANLLDLPAAAALSLIQMAAVIALLVVVGRLRAVPDPTVRRDPAPAVPPRWRDLPAVAVTVATPTPPVARSPSTPLPPRCRPWSPAAAPWALRCPPGAAAAPLAPGPPAPDEHRQQIANPAHKQSDDEQSRNHRRRGIRSEPGEARVHALSRQQRINRRKIGRREPDFCAAARTVRARRA